jgi:hypothetical protein
MATTTKALAMARELMDVWAKQVISTLPIQSLSYDTDGNPVITMTADTSPATTEKNVVVRIKPIAWTAVDIIGHSSQMFGPHVIQVCTETPAAGYIVGPVELMPILGEIAKRGTLVEWYQSDAGTIPATAQMVAAKLTVAWADLYWNAMKAQ